MNALPKQDIWWTAVRFETQCRLDTACPLKVAGRTNSYRCTMTPEVEADSDGRPGILCDLAGCFQTADGYADRTVFGPLDSRSERMRVPRRTAVERCAVGECRDRKSTRLNS